MKIKHIITPFINSNDILTLTRTHGHISNHLGPLAAFVSHILNAIITKLFTKARLLTGLKLLRTNVPIIIECCP